MLKNPSIYVCTSKIHPFSLGNYLETSLVIGTLVRIRVTNVDDEMLIKTYIHMEGEENIELDLSTDKFVDATLGTNCAQGFDMNVELDSIDVDDVAPPTIKLSDAQRHASLLSSFLL